MKIDSVFFDLDGTLMDTAPDLFLAISAILKCYDFPSISYENFRPSVGAGSKSMIEYAFKITEKDSRYSKIMADFLSFYRENIAQKTTIFDGMVDFLSFLEKRNIPWGIVTNKPSALTLPLLSHFSLENRCQALVCGDTLPLRKPNPEPLWHACQLIGANPSESIYIGDTQTDILTAKAAKMHSIAVSYGYYNDESPPQTWSADCVIDSAYDLPNCLEFR